MTHAVGTTIGSFQLQAVLGQGGMATVYLARDLETGAPAAVKFIRMEKLPPELADQFLRRFQQEASQTASLRHPHIVRILATGYAGDDPYLVMEYVPGGTLKDRLTGALTWQDAVRLILPVAQALAYAHERGVIHRDVKPANILLKPDRTPMLADFGIAKTIDGGDTTLGATLTATGALVGTPEYMAPEQARGERVDQRADIYALGVVLFELVTGRRPFTADTPWEVLAKHLTAPVPRPSQLRPRLPGRLDRVILRALAKRPQDRYATMAAFAADLEALLATATPVRPAWILTALGTLAGLTLAGVSAFALWPRAPHATATPVPAMLPRSGASRVPASPMPSPSATSRPTATPLPQTATQTVTQTATPTATLTPTPSAGPTGTAAPTRRPLTPTGPTHAPLPTVTASPPGPATDVPAPSAPPATTVPTSPPVPTSTPPPTAVPAVTETAPPPTRPPTPTA